MTDADSRRLENKIDTVLSLLAMIIPKDKTVISLVDQCFPLQSSTGMVTLSKKQERR